MSAIQAAGTVFVCTCLIGAAWLFAMLMWIVIEAAWSRSRCSVCQGGGHPADYPTPTGWSWDKHRMCTKHLATHLRRKHLEQEAG